MAWMRGIGRWPTFAPPAPHRCSLLGRQGPPHATCSRPQPESGASLCHRVTWHVLAFGLAASPFPSLAFPPLPSNPFPSPPLPCGPILSRATQRSVSCPSLRVPFPPFTLPLRPSPRVQLYAFAERLGSLLELLLSEQAVAALLLLRSLGLLQLQGGRTGEQGRRVPCFLLGSCRCCTHEVCTHAQPRTHVGSAGISLPTGTHSLAEQALKAHCCCCYGLHCFCCCDALRPNAASCCPLACTRTPAVMQQSLVAPPTLRATHPRAQLALEPCCGCCPRLLPPTHTHSNTTGSHPPVCPAGPGTPLPVLGCLQWRASGRPARPRGAGDC